MVSSWFIFGGLRTLRVLPILCQNRLVFLHHHKATNALYINKGSGLLGFEAESLGVCYVISDFSNSRDVFLGERSFETSKITYLTRHCVTTQNTRILSITVVRTSELAR